MPTLSRFLIVLLVLGALIYGVMVGLVAWVKPVTTDLTIDIPPSALKLQDWPYGKPHEPIIFNGTIEGKFK